MEEGREGFPEGKGEVGKTANAGGPFSLPPALPVAFDD